MPSATRPWWEDPAEQLFVADLMQLVDVGIFGARSADRFPELVAAAAEITNQSSKDRRCSALLQDLFAVVLAENVVSMRGIRQREAAGDLFGYSEAAYGLDRVNRLARAASHYGQAMETFRRNDRGGQLPPLVRQVAQSISVLREGVRDPDALYPAASPYVARPALERKILRKFQAGHRRVALVGGPGTGKSHLASTLGIRLNRGLKVLKVSCDSLDNYTADVARVLQSRGVETSAHPAVLRRTFGTMLCTHGAPRIVVLDDVGEPLTPEALGIIVEKTKSKLILTTGDERAVAQFEAERVRMPDRLEADEAAALIQARLAGLSPEEAQALADSFGRHPLMLVQACAYLADAGLDRTQLLIKAAREDLGQAAMAVELGGTARATTQMYAQLFRSGLDDGAAIRRLIALLVAHQGSIAIEVLRELWRGPLDQLMTSLNDTRPPAILSHGQDLLGRDPVGKWTFLRIPSLAPDRPAAGDLAVDSLLRRLDQRCLIDIDPDLARASIGALASSLFAKLHDDDVQVAFERTAETISSHFILGWEPGEALDNDWLPWAPSITSVITAYQESRFGSRSPSSVDMGRLLAIALRAEHQAGQAASEEAHVLARHIYSDLDLATHKPLPADGKEMVALIFGREALGAELRRIAFLEQLTRGGHTITGVPRSGEFGAYAEYWFYLADLDPVRSDAVLAAQQWLDNVEPGANDDVDHVETVAAASFVSGRAGLVRSDPDAAYVGLTIALNLWEQNVCRCEDLRRVVAAGHSLTRFYLEAGDIGGARETVKRLTNYASAHRKLNPVTDAFSAATLITTRSQVEIDALILLLQLPREEQPTADDVENLRGYTYSALVMAKEQYTALRAPSWDATASYHAMRLRAIYEPEAVRSNAQQVAAWARDTKLGFLEMIFRLMELKLGIQSVPTDHEGIARIGERFLRRFQSPYWAADALCAAYAASVIVNAAPDVKAGYRARAERLCQLAHIERKFDTAEKVSRSEAPLFALLVT